MKITLLNIGKSMKANFSLAMYKFIAIASHSKYFNWPTIYNIQLVYGNMQTTVSPSGVDCERAHVYTPFNNVRDLTHHNRKISTYFIESRGVSTFGVRLSQQQELPFNIKLQQLSFKGKEKKRKKKKKTLSLIESQIHSWLIEKHINLW